MIRRMPHAKHPLIAAHTAHAAAHLVRQRLKTEAVIAAASALEIASLGPARRCAARKISIASSKRRFSRFS